MQILQGMGQPSIGQLIAIASALGNGHHQAAATQAGQMIGHRLSSHTQEICQVSRIVRSVSQAHQDPGASRVGEGMAKASKRF